MASNTEDISEERTRKVLDALPIEEEIARLKPEPGTWADVARMMASFGDDDGVDWNAWKDEMKERDIID